MRSMMVVGLVRAGLPAVAVVTNSTQGGGVYGTIGAAAGDYHLLEGSPCIDAGTNLDWMAGATNLDGNPRIHDGWADMGCYEFVPEPGGVWGLVGIGFTIYDLRFTIGRRRGRGEG